jgi:hypothetical protein
VRVRGETEWVKCAIGKLQATSQVSACQAVRNSDYCCHCLTSVSAIYGKRLIVYGFKPKTVIVGISAANLRGHLVVVTANEPRNTATYCLSLEP